MAFVDATVVTVALPHMQDDLHTGLQGEQWIVLSYSLMLAMLYLPGGALADRYGRRRIFLIGVVGFAAASVVCGLAPDEPALIVGRVLQGIAGGLLTPTSLGLLRATYGRDSGAAIGHWSAWTTLATVAGPPAGGALVEWASWRWIFFLNLPLAAGAAGLALAAGPQEEEERGDAGSLDLPGAAVAALSFGALTFALVEAGSRGFRDALVLSTLALGLLLLAAFVLVERGSKEPLLPLGLFRRRNFTVGSIETFLVYGALYASGFLMSLYFQALGFSAFTVGLLGVPTSLVLVAGAAYGGRLATERGPRMPLTAGPLILAGGLLLYLFVHPGTSPWLALPGAIVFGIGLCGIVAPITNVVMQAVPERQAGLAAGVSVTVARVGGLFAVALAGLIAANVFHTHAGTQGKVPMSKNEPPHLQAASHDAFRAGILFAVGLALAGAAVGATGLSNRQALADAGVSSSPT